MCNLAESNEKNEKEVGLAEDYKNQKTFSMPILGGVFNTFEHIVSLGSVDPARRQLMALPASQEWVDFVVACGAFHPAVPALPQILSQGI